MALIYATRNIYSPKECLFLFEIAHQGLETVRLETDNIIENPLIVPVVICKGLFPHGKDLCTHPSEFETCGIALPCWAPFAHFVIAFNVEMDFRDKTRRRQLQKDILTSHESFERMYSCALTEEYSLPHLMSTPNLPQREISEKPRKVRPCW